MLGEADGDEDLICAMLRYAMLCYATLGDPDGDEDLVSSGPPSAPLRRQHVITSRGARWEVAHSIA